ncbi:MULTISPECIES: hypothetical protein [unclassified Nocardioides]|uniref:hypothetical protein n=1 Tax=unclassified Nocardioides TaxID=2615069 RepID=UPI000AB1E517|nr:MULTISPECIES: hypothetical protein [unclassified Nocardioides]
MRIRLAVALSAVSMGTVSMLALSGCGSDLGPDVHPGAAAVVGDHEISIDQVDARAREFCDFNLESLHAQKLEVPMALARSAAIEDLATEQVAEQYAEAHDLDLSEAKATLLPVLRKQAEDALNPKDAGAPPASEESIDEYVDLSLKPTASVIYLAAGMDTGLPAGQKALDRGRSVVQAWGQELEITTDPRFTGDSGQLSVAVSDLTAEALKFANGKSEGKAYLASLPDSQKCG